jgi:transposase-like protein
VRAKFWTQREGSIVEVVKGKHDKQKRRQYSAEFKLETVMKGLRGDRPTAQICRERTITDALYYKGRDPFKSHAPEIVARQDQKDQIVSEQEGRIAGREAWRANWQWKMKT